MPDNKGAYGTHHHGSDKFPTETKVAETLATLQTQGDPREPYTRKEIQEIIGCSKNPLLDRLGNLVDSGIIHKKEAHPRGVVYWIDDSEADRLLG